MTGLIASQTADTTGHAADKEREEEELETAAHEVSEALADWYETQGHLADANALSLSLSGWQRLRDVELLAHAKKLRSSLTTPHSQCRRPG